MLRFSKNHLGLKFTSVLSVCAMLGFFASLASSQSAPPATPTASAPAQQIAAATHPADAVDLASADPHSIMPSATPPAAADLDPIAQREQEILGESGELLALATALNKEVRTTRGDILSMDVIRKAQTIEKLAHGVKEKMKAKAGAS